MGSSITVQPFEFQSDFSAPKMEEAGRIDLPASDFVAFLAQARAEGMVEGRAIAATEDAEKIKAAADRFTGALKDLIQLAEYLEFSSGEAGAPEAVRVLIKSAAQRLIDGQGDLFVEQVER